MIVLMTLTIVMLIVLVSRHRRALARMEEALRGVNDRFRDRGVQFSFDAYHGRNIILSAQLRIKVEAVATTPGAALYVPQVFPTPVAQLPLGAVPVQYAYQMPPPGAELGDATTPGYQLLSDAVPVDGYSAGNGTQLASAHTFVK